MDAHDTGREAGFACLMSFQQIKKSAFEKIGQNKSRTYYKTEKKRQEFFQGWMGNWHEPHPQDCTCKDCQNREDILTF